VCSKASAQKQQTVPLQKNETGQNCWTGRTGNLPPLSDNHETGNAIHQQCTVVIFRRTKTVCWKSYPYQRYGAMIHNRKIKLVVPVEALMSCRKGWCEAPLILNFGARCRMISFTPRSHCPLERTLLPIDQEAGFDSEPVWTIWRIEESLAHLGFEPQTFTLWCSQYIDWGIRAALHIYISSMHLDSVSS
jgi:hypothetical protein